LEVYSKSQSGPLEERKLMKSRRLLCVDDDPLFRQLYKTLFGNLGYEVMVANGGQQALDILRSNRVDALVTDFQMPGMNGHDLSVRVKQSHPELLVVLLSGMRELPAYARQPADLCMEKGAPIYQLAEKLEEVLTARRVPALGPSCFIPLGSALASMLLGAFVLARILK
jgi:CheY-like chemotaxis protein